MKVHHRRDHSGIRILLIAAMFATMFGAVAMLFDYMLAPLRPDISLIIVSGSAVPAAIYECAGLGISSSSDRSSRPV